MSNGNGSDVVLEQVLPDMPEAVPVDSGLIAETTHTHLPGPDFQFEFFTNAEQQALVERIVRSILWPYWAKDVRVQCFGSDDDTPELRVKLKYEYRRVELEVYSTFFSQACEVQRDHVQHEVYHTILATVLDWNKRHVLEYIREKNPELFEHFRAELCEREESVVQELVYLGRHGQAMEAAPS